MFRVISSILLIALTISAKEVVEIFAERVVAKSSSVVEATGDVLLLYDNSVIKVDRAIFDKDSSTLKLSGDVQMVGDGENRLYSDSLTIDMGSRDISINGIFLGGDDNLWIDASRAEKVGNHYRLMDSRISSCNRVNPDWTIEFKRADYYKDREILTMEDARVRFYDTTLIYLPYLALPTVHKRSTGLLYPRFKFTSRDGFVYEQSYFYAEEPNWDIEITPQFRVRRGGGGYFTARFVDSNHSSGYIRGGYFRNIDSYADDKSLNRTHSGLELFYSSTSIIPEELLPKDYRSGLYINGIYLSDREYLNLQKDRVSSYVSSNLIESRLNAILYNTKNYFGLYGKYNIDVSRSSNEETIQELPSLHYHRYLQQLINNRLFYTVDARLHNYTRDRGSRATQLELDIPITYYNSIVSDYINFSASENIYLTRVDFRNIESREDYYYYYRNYHTLKLSSDLVKDYGEFRHVINPTVTYIIPSHQAEEPLDYSDLESEKRELFTTYTKEEQISIGFNQYFLNHLEGELSHSLEYNFYPKRSREHGDIVNEIEYSRGSVELFNRFKYAVEEHQLQSSTTSITYNKPNYDIMLRHFYNNDLLFNRDSGFLESQFRYKIDGVDSYIATFDYNLKQGYNHKWSLGWSHRANCWSGRVTIGQEIVPNRDSSFKNTALYVELNLYPIGGIKQNFEEDFSSQGDRN